MSKRTRFSAQIATLLAIFALAAAPIPTFASGGGGGGGMGGMGGSSSGPATVKPKKPKTPEQIAQSRYEAGLSARDKAMEYERKAKEGAKGWFGGDYATSAAEEWKEAIAAYEEAVAKKPTFHEAYSDLGYARRKTGDYTSSLAAYDKALELSPDYAPALEYVGETYLALNRVSNARDTYMKLFGVDRKLAKELMEAMAAWAKTAQPSDALTSEELEGFRSWVTERQQLAMQLGDSVADARGW